MKKLVFLFLMMFVIGSCKNEREKCVRKCAKEAIVDLGKCSEMKPEGDSSSCTSAAKKKGRDCLAACPEKK